MEEYTSYYDNDKLMEESHYKDGLMEEKEFYVGLMEILRKKIFLKKELLLE